MGMYACLPGSADCVGHGNPEIRGSTFSAGPVAKTPHKQCQIHRENKGHLEAY